MTHPNYYHLGVVTQGTIGLMAGRTRFKRHLQELFWVTLLQRYVKHGQEAPGPRNGLCPKQLPVRVACHLPHTSDKQKENTAYQEETESGNGWVAMPQPSCHPTCPSGSPPTAKKLALIIQEGSVKITRRRPHTTDPLPPKCPVLSLPCEAFWVHTTHSTPSRT